MSCFTLEFTGLQEAACIARFNRGSRCMEPEGKIHMQVKNQTHAMQSNNKQHHNHHQVLCNKKGCLVVAKRLLQNHPVSHVRIMTLTLVFDRVEPCVLFYAWICWTTSSGMHCKIQSRIMQHVGKRLTTKHPHLFTSLGITEFNLLASCSNFNYLEFEQQSVLQEGCSLTRT